MKRSPIAIPWSAVRDWLPSRGNVLFTILLLASIFVAGRAGAIPGLAPAGPTATSTSLIAYQGRLADAAGYPLTGSYPMSFALYSAASGGVALWGETQTVSVSDGIFSVMLGAATPIPTAIASNASLYLGITVRSDSEMTPRRQLGSAAYALQGLTVPDSAITTGKLADGAVTPAKLDTSQGLTVTGVLTATSNIAMGGVLTGDTAYWADYRAYLRFMKQSGVTESQLCPEGGAPVGVLGPTQALSLLTGSQICAKNADLLHRSCLNVHQVRPCGSIQSNKFPYAAESCASDFHGMWAPFYWWDGSATQDFTNSIMGGDYGCFSVRYACCN